MNRILHAFAVCLFAAALAPAQSSKPAEDLQALAKSAVTPRQHEEVAKRYRDRAVEFTAKAEAHEKKAASLMRQPAPPISHKWPAMQPKPWEKERQLAMQARRAAEEASQLAARHYQLAGQAETKPADVDF
jgi:hypothetical protein